MNKTFLSIAIFLTLGLFLTFFTSQTFAQTAVPVNETKSSIGQEKEELKPVSDEMLEYSAEKFGINLSLPRETNLQILNNIFDDPESGLQSFKNLENTIDSLDDNLNEVQEKLYVECTVKKESGVFNKTLDCTKWSFENAKGTPVPIY